MWDVFISHASEDKDKIVKPLANTLRNFGVSVWYDEFELKLGDSLSKSIDKGLINSKFGVIVLSPSFFEKGWTDYELRSLTNKEIGNKKVILPVWHDITREEISAHSLFLADKFAIPTNLGLNELSQKIIEIVRPDIINTFALKAFARTGNFTKEKISLNNILQSEVERHKTLPSYVSISVKLMCDVMADIGLSDYNFFLSNLKKDADYDSEYIIWNAITCSYISFIQHKKIDFSNIEKKRSIFNFLIILSLQIDSNENNLSDDDRQTLTKLYLDNLTIFLEIYKA